MRIDITGMALCATLLLAGCNAPATADGDDATVAATAPAAEPAAAPEAVDAAAAGSDQAVPAAAGLPPGMSERDAMGFAVAMAVGVELCGISTPAETRAGLDKMKAQSGGMSAAEIDAIYDAARQQGQAQAAEDPAKFERGCESLRRMTDPAEVAKMEAAVKAMEAKAAEMEARSR